MLLKNNENKFVKATGSRKIVATLRDEGIIGKTNKNNNEKHKWEQRNFSTSMMS